MTKVRRSIVLPKICESWRLSQRRGCKILAINRSILHYRSVKYDEPVLRQRIVEMANLRIKYGYNRIASRLRLEGWHVNRKRVYRIYREEGLVLRRKTPKRRRAAVVREERVTPTAVNQSWAMDFMHDLLADGRKYRLLTIVDIFSRESLAIDVDFHFKAAQLVDVLRRLIGERGAPARIHCDNGPEFISVALDQWAYFTKVQLDFSRPGQPSDNAFCESFNNRVRQELLNPNWFYSIEQVRAEAEGWRVDYNTFHPHSSLGNLAPEEFARRARNTTREAAISEEPAV